MAFWSRLLGGTNLDPPQADSPGDPKGVELVGEETFTRSAPMPVPSPWDGWPSGWNASWNSPALGLSKLIDTAWACVDLNASVLSAMPVYRLQSGVIVSPRNWMINPDPRVYTGWTEFAKQLFWDYQMGEVFVYRIANESDGYPLYMRVVPPWLVNVEIGGGGRVYNIGSKDVTEDILHIRYQSTTVDAHGHGPLEVAGARMTTAGLLQRYAKTLAETGGTPHYWLGITKWLNQTEADELLQIWIDSRKRHQGEPAVLSGGADLHQAQSMSAKEMALLELAQFSESRIAVLLGVPPFLVGLPSGADSLTYANISQLFDFHDRSSLRPKAQMVMEALTNWATPRGQAVELNRDEYSRPDFAARAQAYALLLEKGVLSADEVRVLERLNGDAPGALTGNDTAPTQVNVTTGNPAANGGNNNAVQGY